MKYPERFYSKRMFLRSNPLYTYYRDWDHTPSDQDIEEQEKVMERHMESLKSFIRMIDGEGKTIMYLDKNNITPDEFLNHCHS